ncbi:nad-aldehyde dehydrogenase [Phaffia rhodozyma]|uniref:Nad-aldehyde dehydrogenase n=1 Tax=Phaffia rhodozyma TaxID=264483 RepID=A0A0F7SUP5_PHARH|nr:nad-aldehyde dehydrogenase [Phaffia rhodozyma]
MISFPISSASRLLKPYPHSRLLLSVLHHRSTSSFTLPSGLTTTIQTGLFLNNEFVPSIGGQTFKSISPLPPHSDLATISEAHSADVDQAIAYARTAFKTTWGKRAAPGERARLLNRLADLIEQNASVLSEIEAWDSGKPLGIVRDLDIVDVVATLRYYAVPIKTFITDHCFWDVLRVAMSDKIHGQTTEVNDMTRLSFTKHEPIGVCAQIVPWNYPLMMMSWKIAPALAVGCCVVLKPSEFTSLSALKFAELVVEAGYPPGVFQILTGDGKTGGVLASHQGIDKVSFTGSTATGRKIMEASAKSNLKPVSLELGGKSPGIIFESADLDQATNWAMLGTFFNMGQDCTCNSRVFVQASVYDKVIEMLVAKSKLVTIGDQNKEGVNHGPLVSKSQYEKVMSFIEAGKVEGATLAAGGKSWGEDGWWVEPTIFTDCKPGMKIVDEEIFGPVMAVQKFETEEEVIKLANNTSYGLAAGFFSKDMNQCLRVVGELEAGTVWVNMTNILNPQIPFGGKKQSGFGKDLGAHALENYTSVKAVQMNFGEDFSWPM